MKILYQLWKVRRFKAWLIASISLLVLFSIISIGATQIKAASDTLSIVFGGPRQVLVSGDPSGYKYFEADEEYLTKEAVYQAGNDLNEQIESEGIVLLKNENNLLPLSAVTNISVFGKNSINLVYGGSGSGGGNFAGAATLYESLADAGFTVNPVLQEFYENNNASGSGRNSNPSVTSTGVLTGFATGETPLSSYTQAIRDSYADYDDAALVVISRIGGEAFDLPRTMKDKNGNPVVGAASSDDHYLELDQNEQDLLEDVCENFEKVVLIINSGTSMELGFLDDVEDNDSTMNDYDYDGGIQAALWVGGPGFSGAMAIGKVLNGEVNPSGHLVDTYVRDFSQDPTWSNFGNNLLDKGNQYYYIDGDKIRYQNFYFVDYEEGIYVGYRYYETRGFTDGDTWYENNVVFPLGYGLSYTSFEWEIRDTSPNDNARIDIDEDIIIEVEVTNTGNVAGSDVVQVYVTPPYYPDEIEKSHVVLVGFAKTSVLQPSKSETVSILFTPYDFASYDYNDANNNGFSGYELDEGDYQIKVCTDAHSVVENVTYKVPEGGYQFETDPTTDYEVKNRYDSTSAHVTTVLSREDWSGTYPSTPTEAEREVAQEFITQLESRLTTTPVETVIPNQSPVVLTAEEVSVFLYELIGTDYDDPLWEAFLSQLTFEQIRNFVSDAAFKTISINELGIPFSVCADGPSGFVNFMGDPTVNGTVAYASPIVVASTWNVDLAEAQGNMVGNEGILGDQTRAVPVSYTGWYAPAMNIHRSPFSGRNNEYYSEDGLLSGLMASSVIKGATNKGVITFIKHFAVNDQETHRDRNGLVTWLDEQCMREIYLKPFELSVKKGGSLGIMSSFNRIGTVWTGGDYDLLTEILRNEWGFRGSVITDFNLTNYMDVTQMVLAGGDLNLSNTKSLTYTDYTDATFATALRNAAHNTLYALANSNAMNGYGGDVIYRDGWTPWQQALLIIDLVVVAAIGTWGGLVIAISLKKIKH